MRFAVDGKATWEVDAQGGRFVSDSRIAEEHAMLQVGSRPSWRETLRRLMTHECIPPLKKGILIIDKALDKIQCNNTQ